MARRVTFSRNLTLSLSRTCRAYCKYCAFATHQPHLHEPDEVLALLDVQVTVTASGRRKGDSVTLDMTGAVAHDQLLRSSADWHLPGGADGAA